MRDGWEMKSIAKGEGGGEGGAGIWDSLCEKAVIEPPPCEFDQPTELQVRREQVMVVIAWCCPPFPY